MDPFIADFVASHGGNIGYISSEPDAGGGTRQFVVMQPSGFWDAIRVLFGRYHVMTAGIVAQPEVPAA
ncbi:MAG TPA: hypothetical protein VLF67_03565 [Candidatus Saccharimonas sp.]|nr:hypothetical protein [Candidatus Saccharimonas sp.]